jgi:Regulator of competence-specific genes
MASDRATVDFIREQMEGAGEVTTRAMFGEYALYLDGKVIALICDDTLFLKATPGALALIDEPEFGPPYPGAKPHLIGSALLDEPEALVALARAIWDDLPAPKPRKPRKPRAGA